jgi:bis(5'-nucleosidyl)-tetraphosphatase
MRYEKSCGALIIRKFGGVFKVLLTNGVKDGCWSFPRGELKEDETELESVVRVAGEQYGLDVVLDMDFRYVSTYLPRRAVTKDVIYYLAISDQGETVPPVKEVNEAEWVTLQEAASRVLYSSDLALLESAEKYIHIKYK